MPRAPGFDRVRTILETLALPGVEEGTSYGTPAFKVKKKFLLRLREPDVLVLVCPIEEKEFLIENQPDIYFETDHYKGWPAVLIRLSKIGDAELAHRLKIAWRMRAPAKLAAAVDGAAEAAAPRRPPSSARPRPPRPSRAGATRRSRP
jgi:hypothetical protein